MSEITRKQAKKIYINAPCWNDPMRDLEEIRKYKDFVSKLGYISVFSGHDYGRPMADYLSEEYENVKDRELIRQCDEMWVFSDNLTKLMKREIEDAGREKINVRYFNEDCKEMDGEEEGEDADWDIELYLNKDINPKKVYNVLGNSIIWKYIEDSDLDIPEDELDEFVLCVGFAMGYIRANEPDGSVW